MALIGNPLNSVAFLTDSFNGNGSTTAFTMSVAPATSSSILVVITGVTQAPSTYSVVGTTLTFSTAPPSGTANISVRYLGIPASGVTTTAYRTLTEFTATASQTTFTPPSYTVGFIAVYQNGVMLGSTDYTATNGTTVVLAVGALVNDLVTTESFYVSSVLNAIPATAGAVNSSYIASGAVGSTQIATGAVTQTLLGTNVAGNGPSFSARKTSNQSVPSNPALVTFDTEEWDTNNNFASSTFTPTVSGYYQFNLCLQSEASTLLTRVIVCLYKNGILQEVVQDFSGSGTINPVPFKTSGSVMSYANGTSDYFQFYAYVFASTPIINGNLVGGTYFQAFLTRSA